MKELDAVIGELDATASVAQTKGGSVSWRKVREIAFRLSTITIGKALIPKGSHDYLRDHHQITSSHIGLAKMALLRNNPTKAMEYLQAASAEIDESIRKHLPEHHAALQQLRSGNQETENVSQ
jgi:hypothetical protein